MKIHMITTFFGEHSFGGDAAYVERLSETLCRRGHQVYVSYCVDAFKLVRGARPLRDYSRPPALHVHPLKSRFGILSPLATHVTGRPWLKTPPPCQGSRRSRNRSLPLSQRVARRRPGHSRPRDQSPGRPAHDCPRTLADLSHACLEI